MTAYWLEVLITLAAGGALGLLWNISRRMDEIATALKQERNSS
jgi:hypothetical protein